MRLPDPSPVLDKNRVPMGPGILSTTGAGVYRKAPKAFPDSSSVLDKFQAAKTGELNGREDLGNRKWGGKTYRVLGGGGSVL